MWYLETWPATLSEVCPTFHEVSLASSTKEGQKPTKGIKLLLMTHCQFDDIFKVRTN